MKVDLNGRTALVTGGGRGIRCAISTSVADPADVSRIFALCMERLGRLDILANNAGRTTPRFAPLHELSPAEWDAVMDVNYGGALAMLRGALAIIVEAGGGVIVNTVSISALKALPFGRAYSVSKAALAMLTRQAAVEYAARGIRVNGIMPGVTRTPILDEVPPETMEAIIASIPKGRVAKPDEIANLVAILASEEAAYINGALPPVDGAASA